jgi:hypothetical protein
MTFAFLVSFLSFFHINLVGDFYIAELLLIGYLLLSIRKLRLLAEPFPRKVLILGGLWLLSQVLTDFIRNTPSQNYLRGWAAIVFFLVDFCAMYIMARLKPDVVRILILGSALGTIFSVIALPTEYSEMEPWKFGYGQPTVMLLLLYLSIGNKHAGKLAPVLLIALGVLSVFLNARSLGGMLMLTAAIILLGQLFGFGKYNAMKISFTQWISMIAGVSIAVFGIAMGYQWAAESDYLPENVIAKYKLGQANDLGILGMLVGGRSEILISSQAVFDSPIIGHGSWAEDAKYAYMQYEIAAILGQDDNEAQVKQSIEMSNLIPTHSVLMQAWVWAGLLGAIFWFFVIKLLLKNTFAIFFIPNKLQPLLIFLGISSVWNVLFSPFGGGERFDWALVLVVIFISVGVLTKMPVNTAGAN